MATSRKVGHGRKALAVVVWTLVLGGALVFLTGQQVGWWQLLEVQGGSMQPTIANGSLLLTTPEDVDQVHPGDVVSLIGADGLRVTHRVVDVNSDTGAITTRGDANTVNDAQPYQGQRIDLVRWHLPAAGWVLRLSGVLRWYLYAGAALTLVISLPLDRLLSRLRRPGTRAAGGSDGPESVELQEHARRYLEGATSDPAQPGVVELHEVNVP